MLGHAVLRHALQSVRSCQVVMWPCMSCYIMDSMLRVVILSRHTNLNLQSSHATLPGSVSCDAMQYQAKSCKVMQHHIMLRHGVSYMPWPAFCCMLPYRLALINNSGGEGWSCEEVGLPTPGAPAKGGEGESLASLLFVLLLLSSIYQLLHYYY